MSDDHEEFAVDAADDAELADGAAEALARARADARSRGIRPGSKSAVGRYLGRRRRQASTPVDPTYSGAGPDARDPQQLSGIVDGMVGSNAWGAPLAIGTVLAKWSEIVGPDNAAHSEPLRIDAGELVIQADSSTWAQALRLLVPAIQRRLDEVLGPDVVTRITIRGPSAPSWKKGPLSVPGRGPRDTYG